MTKYNFIKKETNLSKRLKKDKFLKQKNSKKLKIRKRNDKIKRKIFINSMTNVSS
jgi:hypothetical protein